MTTMPGRTHLLWAKSDAGGRPHSLPGHLLDAAAVAELIWDEFLSRAAHKLLDEVSDGRGRDLLVMVAALHDVGKATPAFQTKDLRGEFPAIRNAHRRLALPGLDGGRAAAWNKWYHGPAGALIVGEYLRQVGQPTLEWVLPIIEGHHGRMGTLLPRVPGGMRRAHGGTEWNEIQRELVDEIVDEIDVDLTSWQLRFPSRGLQLAFAGLIVMADWIASSDLFPGLGLEPVSMEDARVRARRAWDALALRGGWRDLPPVADSTSLARFFEGRFGFPPRPLQDATIKVIDELDDVGLIIVEAPMGEGKTEAAEAAVELLARGRGFGGYLFCMPTQGTTDAMYHRVSRWSDAIDASVCTTLLHGKAALNEEWLERSQGITFGEVYTGDDEFGVEDPYGYGHSGSSASSAPSSWFQGRYRGLLAPAVVATVDQGLWAGTRTRFVALRHAGLLGKVVVIDEVHAYDAWMSVFLKELLRWCARMGTPVILMSATLPPKVRSGLVEAWSQGAGREAPSFLGIEGYPVVTGVSQTGHTVIAVEQYREDHEVKVSVPGIGTEDVGEIAALAADLVSDGGCALVILNEVRRAQETWQRLVTAGVPALLIHGRFTAAERARRTSEALRLFGSDGERPSRMVIVATQIAEQSFDVDADVLITDIAPMDLLLQRIGRLHRHAANVGRRPERLREPQVYVTGVALDGRPPVFPQAFTHIYRDWPLLESAAALKDGDVKWNVPSQVPELVARAYDDAWRGPDTWRERVEAARSAEQTEANARMDVAGTFRLDSELDMEREDLRDLHRLGSPVSVADEGSAMVRDGIDTQEVIVVRRRGGEYWTLGGRPLMDDGQRASDPKIAREILGDTVRVRDYLAKEIQPLGAWITMPLLARMPVLVLDDSGPKNIGGWLVSYDDDLGLVVEK